MRFPIFGMTNDDPGTADTYAYVANGSAVDWLTTENRRQIPTDDMAVSSAKFFVDTAPGVGNTRTYTVRRNGADTGVTATISGTNTSATFNGTVSFADGDRLSLKQSTTGTPAAPGNTYWWLTLNTVGNKWLLMGACQNVAPNGAINYCNPFHAAAWTTTSAAQDTVVPTGGTVVKHRVCGHTTPGAGKSYELSLRVNNTTDALTVTVNDAETADVVTGTQALAAGDTIQYKANPISTPTQVAYGWCLTIEPTVNGESFTGFGAATAVSTSATNYEQFVGVGAGGWAAANTSRRLRLPACSFKKFHGRISTAPGVAASRTFTLQDNGAATALTFTISGAAATTGSDVANTVAHTGDNLIAIESTVSAVPNPAAANAHLGMVILTAQPPEVSYGYVY